MSRGQILPPSIVHKCEIYDTLIGEGSILVVRPILKSRVCSSEWPNALALHCQMYFSMSRLRLTPENNWMPPIQWHQPNFSGSSKHVFSLVCLRMYNVLCQSKCNRLLPVSCRDPTSDTALWVAIPTLVKAVTSRTQSFWAMTCIQTIPQEQLRAEKEK